MIDEKLIAGNVPPSISLMNAAVHISYTYEPAELPKPKTAFQEAVQVFWHAAKETPQQMVAPFVAAWRELVKNAQAPQRPKRAAKLKASTQHFGL